MSCVYVRHSPVPLPACLPTCLMCVCVVFQVNAGSLAAVAGLQAGDAIVSIGGKDALSLRHKEAQEAIVKAGNNFDLVIQR